MGRLISLPAPAYICCMCYSLLGYTGDSVYHFPNQCGDDISQVEKGKEEWKDKIVRSSGRERELLSENGTPQAAGRRGFCSPRKRRVRRGRQQSQGSFSCWTPITGGGSQLRQSTEQPCPKGKTEVASSSLFKCSCYIRDLTSCEMIMTLPDKATLNSKHALTNYIPR